MNIDILGISEIKWTGKDAFNSDDHCIYYCRQESLRRNGVAITVKESQREAKMQYLEQSQNDRMTSIHFRGKPFNITIIQICVLNRKAEEVEVE